MKAGYKNNRGDRPLYAEEKHRPMALSLESSGSPTKEFSMESPVPTTSSSGRNAKYGINGDMKQFEIDHVLRFHPPGAWQSKFCLGDGPGGSGIPYDYHISTSFLKPGFTISCPGGVDHIKIVCYGILTFKVLYSKEQDPNAFGDGVVVSVIEVPPAQMGQRQRVEVKTPWPSMKVEAVVDQQSDDFVAIFGVSCYTSSRPSALSTPINEGKRDGPVMEPYRLH